MTTILADHQFEILPTENAASGFVFGIGADVSLDDAGFDPGESAWVTQDSQNSRTGVTNFGRDVLGSQTWTWSSHINRHNEVEALDTLGAFSAAWRPRALVRDPGAMTALRYQIAGRVRRVYGRPRRFAAPPSNLILNGYVPVTHDFAMVDACSYSDAQSSLTIGYSSEATDGGFRFPTVFPVVTVPSDDTGVSQITVGGNEVTYPIIRFNGPWTNPVFQTDDWTLRWNGSIPAGGWVEVDCRPWAMTVLNQSGASVVGGLPAKTWLEDFWFEPGSQPQVILGGVSATSSALVRWRDAWTSY